MVFSCHFDLLSNYWQAHRIVYHQVLPEVKKGITGMRPIVCLHSLWLFIVRPIIDKGKDLWPEQWCPEYDCNFTNFEAWQQFVSQPNIHWALFLLKLPYLIFELLMIIVIFKMLGQVKYPLINFLIFNPITLFINYIFGGYDMIPVFFLVLSIYFITRQRILLSLLALGIAIIIKSYILILAPFYIIFLKKSWFERIKLISWIIFPLIIWYFLEKFIRHTSVLSSLRTLQYSKADFLISFRIPFQGSGGIFCFFVICYCLLIFSAIYIRQREEIFDTLIKYITASILFFYSFCYFYPQYFLLTVPLMALQFNYRKELLPLFYIQTICFFVYTFQFGGGLSWHLFMPFNPQFFANLKPPYELINLFYPADKFIGIFRSMFSAVSFLMVYLLLKAPGYPANTGRIRQSTALAV